MHMYTHTHIHTPLHTHTSSHTHTVHIHIHTHTYIHTHNIYTVHWTHFPTFLYCLLTSKSGCARIRIQNDLFWIRLRIRQKVADPTGSGSTILHLKICKIFVADPHPLNPDPGFFGEFGSGFDVDVMTIQSNNLLLQNSNFLLKTALHYIDLYGQSEAI